MTPKVKRELEAFTRAETDDERAKRVEAIAAVYRNPDPCKAAGPDRDAVALAAEFLETDPDEAERIVREHFAPPEPKRLVPLPFGAVEPPPVLWRAPVDPAVAWNLADAVLSEGEVAILSGPGGTGKSTLALQVALVAAEAAPGRDRHRSQYGEACGLRMRPGPVVFVSYEDSNVRMAARLEHIAANTASETSGSGLSKIQHWPNPGPLYVGIDGGREQRLGADWVPLWAAVRAMDPAPSLVVIDPASAALEGVSMNEGGPVRTFMGELALEAKLARCGVLVVVHDTRAARNAGKEGDDPGANATAGSATWFDAPGGMLYLTRKGDEGRRELRCLKANYGRSGWTVMLDERFDGAGRFVGFEVANLAAPAARYAAERDCQGRDSAAPA